MHANVFVRGLSEDESTQLSLGLRSRDGFVLRRCQILLSSARGEKAGDIAHSVGCSHETVRQVIHDFNRSGLKVLKRKSTRPHETHPAFAPKDYGLLKALLHQSPRDYDYPSSLWSLDAVAEVCHRLRFTDRQVSGETIRSTLKRMGVTWKRAKHWITSPDPAYERKKARRDRLIGYASHHEDWVVGFEDECWWSRFEQPRISTWSEQAIRLVQQEHDKQDEEPKAIACYGVVVSCPADKHGSDQVWIRFVDGRPVSNITTQFLEWGCQQLQELGKRVWVLIWDNASWHKSKEVRNWIREHNRDVKSAGKGVRIIRCQLPVKSPWLNPIEPRWAHAKKKLVEPDATLTIQQLEHRVCQHFNQTAMQHLSKKVT